MTPPARHDAVKRRRTSAKLLSRIWNLLLLIRMPSWDGSFGVSGQTLITCWLCARMCGRTSRRKKPFAGDESTNSSSGLYQMNYKRRYDDYLFSYSPASLCPSESLRPKVGASRRGGFASYLDLIPSHSSPTRSRGILRHSREKYWTPK